MSHRQLAPRVLQVFPTEKVRSALKTVFDNNVQRFGGGRMGAINGCKPGGAPDRTTVQSEEFWTGVSYALAANLLQEVSSRTFLSAAVSPCVSEPILHCRTC